jgi:deoxyribose-phosphate aldolase
MHCVYKGLQKEMETRDQQMECSAYDLANVIAGVRREIDRLHLPQVEGVRPNPPAQRQAPQQEWNLAPLIEHTLLKPEATSLDIARLCEEAVRFKFLGVCVNPVFVSHARNHVDGSAVRVVTVVGFPLGASLTATKVVETSQVREQGANEVDMVISIGALKEGAYEKVYQDIRSVVTAAGILPVKVIIEAGLLSQKEKVAACILADKAGAAFVKTSTGFAWKEDAAGARSLGATVEDVQLMSIVVGGRLGVKAAGGIRNASTARSFVKVGASRLGTSSSVSIVSNGVGRLGSGQRDNDTEGGHGD